MSARCLLIAAVATTAALALPVLGQQGSLSQTGSFLSGSSKPLTFKPIALPKVPPPVIVPDATAKPSIFSLSRYFPKISLGAKALPAPPGPTTIVSPK